VAFLASRRATRQEPIVTGVTLWFRQTSNSVAIPCPSFSSTTTGLYPMASPRLPDLRSVPPTGADNRPLVQTVLELGTLHSTLVLAFHFFSLAPFPVSRKGQEPTTTFQPSSGCAIFRPPISTRRLAPSGEVAVLQGFVTCLPSRPTLRRSFTLNKHRSH